MRDLSLHILDLVQNSVTAGADLIEVGITLDKASDTLTITIQDDGSGMSPELLARVKSPFTTTRTTRPVGLGIPLFMENAEKTGGTLEIWSELGTGTRLTATFGLSHIDRPPMGDLADTFLTLILATPAHPDYVLRMTGGAEDFVFDTREMRQVLGGVPLDTPDVIDWMREALREGTAPYLV